MALILIEFYKHNTWANLRLIDVCAVLPDEQLDATAPGTFGSIRDTLVHLIAAQERYLAAITGEEPANPLRRNGGFPGFLELRERAHRTGEGLVTRVEHADSIPTVHTIWHGEPLSLPTFVFFVQAINHATEHRAHVATILGALGIEPPGLDGWTYGEDPAGR